MPTSKTFASGAPLPAADVNAHLAHIVPVAGAAPDTGWLDLSTGAVVVRARRVGMVVTVHLVLTGTYAGNVLPINGGVAILPAGMRPAGDAQGAGRGDHVGIATLPVMMFVAPNGAMVLVKDPNITQYISASATYLCA